MIDLTGLDNVQTGDTVTIYGKDPTLRELADLINGDTLEILDSGSENISRFYKEKGDK